MSQAEYVACRDVAMMRTPMPITVHAAYLSLLLARSVSVEDASRLITEYNASQSPSPGPTFGEITRRTE